MALLLDPRMKGGVGIPNTDKEFILARIRDKLVLTLQLRKKKYKLNQSKQIIITWSI
jgi:hypothetical protein